MEITSLAFLLFVTIGVIVYYLLPMKVRWVELLVLSLVFYYYAGSVYTIIYLVVQTFIAYISTLMIARFRRVDKNSNKSKIIMFGALVLNFLIWFVVKGRGFWGILITWVAERTGFPLFRNIMGVEIVATLGMSYYTLQIMGYIIDCYWETIKPQTNIIKLFLFASYFPQLISGPISRYSQLETLFVGHRISYHNVAFGAQRILWGFAKKLILSERIGIIVNGIISNSDTYFGFYSWIAILLYPIQLYADFSGCMDIVLGVSELFGIFLPENFNNPFLARNAKEFWRRWHITLGTWAKDYILYPMLKSSVMIKIGSSLKKKYGKKVGKFIVNFLSMFFLWTIIGIWHGAPRYIVGVTLLYWFVVMIDELSEPVLRPIAQKYKMKTESFAWHLFQSIRSYGIFSIGAAFFSLGIHGGVRILKDALKVVLIKGCANPWIFFDGSVLNLGLSYADINLIIIMIALLLTVAILREKYGYARIWIEKQSIVFRWMIWYSLFVVVLIYGKYGTEYNASAFIYQGF